MQPGADQLTHLEYLRSFDTQFRAGEFYPRWMSALNYGAGSPIFFVQYPFPFFASEGLLRVFHLGQGPEGYSRALGLFMFGSALLSGIFTWLWCRTFVDEVPAMLASFAALTIPYLYSFDLYWRADVGEFSAYAWTPLALYWIHRLDSRRWRAVAGLAVTFAVIVMSHLFTAVFLSPFLFAYAMWRAPEGKRIFAGARAAVGLALGLTVAAVYVAPVYVHRGFFDIGGLIRLRDDNFYYRHQLFAFGRNLFPTMRMRWMLLDVVAVVSAVAACSLVAVRFKRMNSALSKSLTLAAVLLVLITCAAPFFYYVGFVPHPDDASLPVVDLRSRLFIVAFITFEIALFSFVFLDGWKRRIATCLFAASTLCYFLMTRWSSFFWDNAKVLWSIQFPWRLIGVLSVCTVGLLASLIQEAWQLPRDSKRKFVVAGACFWVLFAGASAFSIGIAKKFVHSNAVVIPRELDTAYATYAKTSNLPSEEELGPKDGLSSGAVVSQGTGAAQLQTISARHLRLTVDCATACGVTVRQIYYPFWQAREDSGAAVNLEPSHRAGLMQLSMDPGVHQVDLTLPREKAETYGVWLSVCGFIVVVLMAFL
jgi:hypothetical protein